ncbi:MAG TPA: indolepyruvate ferredoxin oxidoreductase subunit alpha, partial [Clostridiales bacterium]|nr:indolepyruvate ferredoxin oxidoreductase subunit alpha [Clostridiales bacterium]
MKELLLGNAAVARGLYEAGCRFASSYPGTPSTEITEELSRYGEVFCEWAPNEKVALEAACGASIAGARSFCGMKHVGLNVAADPLFTASYTGVNGGLVV